MLKRKLIFIVSLSIMLMPFLGFPNSFEDTFFVVAGFIIISAVYLSSGENCSQCENEVTGQQQINQTTDTKQYLKQDKH